MLITMSKGVSLRFLVMSELYLISSLTADLHSLLLLKIKSAEAVLTPSVRTLSTVDVHTHDLLCTEIISLYATILITFLLYLSDYFQCSPQDAGNNRTVQ